MCHVAGAFPCIKTCLSQLNPECHSQAIHLLAMLLAARVPAYAVQTLFCDELNVPLAPHLSQFVPDKLTEALQALDCALKRPCDTGMCLVGYRACSAI